MNVKSIIKCFRMINYTNFDHLNYYWLGWELHLNGERIFSPFLHFLQEIDDV